MRLAALLGAGFHRSTPMADDQQAAAPAAGGRKKLIILVGAIVALVGIAGGAVVALTGGDAGHAEQQAAASPAETLYINLEPEFVINFRDKNDRPKYLKAELSVATKDPEFEAWNSHHMPANRNRSRRARTATRGPTISRPRIGSCAGACPRSR
jgi:flagellar basal body-associated protein FliL